MLQTSAIPAVKNRSILKCLALAICIVTLPVSICAQESTHKHWGYDGGNAPKHWSELNPEYATCETGHVQSPIDIANAKQAELPPLRFNYHAVPLNIVNNGHTVMVNYAPGSTVTVDDKTFALRQFHFHHPSENHIAGQEYDLEAHLVHADADGHNAVVAIMFKEGPTPSPCWIHFGRTPPQKKERS